MIWSSSSSDIAKLNAGRLGKTTMVVRASFLHGRREANIVTREKEKDYRTERAFNERMSNKNERVNLALSNKAVGETH